MWWPTKRAYLSATAISEEDISRFLADVIKNKIVWMVGYCASLEYVADYVLRNNLKIDGIKLIWSTSSPLTKIVRQKIERAFHCKVMDQYGCCEMGNIAIQKPNEDYLTINSDYVHVDIATESGKLVTNDKLYGDVLITDLNTKEFPLIKYRLGDKSRIIKTAEESEDGFPKMEFVQGRISDAIWLPDGTYVDGAFLTTICDNYSDYIACYQIHQQMDYSINISFVPKEGVDGTTGVIEKIIIDLENLTSNQVKISSIVVSEIPDFAGKRKFIVSEISLARIKK
jgi:phenylacetate-CoA ligase